MTERTFFTLMTVVVLSVVLLIIGLPIYLLTTDTKLGRPYSTVTCSLNGIVKIYKHVQVKRDPQSWAHGMYFEYKGKEVSVQDTFCIQENE